MKKYYRFAKKVWTFLPKIYPQGSRKGEIA